MYSGALDGKFFGDVKNVVLAPCRGVPVDVAERKTFGIGFDGLLKTFAQQQQVGELRVGSHQAIEGNIFERSVPEGKNVY